MSEQKNKLDMDRLVGKIKETNDLKSLRMEIALALQHKAKTEDIYEILDAGLLRAWDLGEECGDEGRLERGNADNWLGERRWIELDPSKTKTYLRLFVPITVEKEIERLRDLVHREYCTNTANYCQDREAHDESSP